MTAPIPTSVLIGRFEDLIARGLSQVVGSDPNLEIVAEDIESARLGVVLRALAPRVAIIDADALPKLSAIAELSQHHPDTQVVLLASAPTAAESAQLLAFGASACLSRDTEARDVLSAIHLSARGLQLIPRARELEAGSPAQPISLLTPREAEILPFLQQGSTNAQIADLLQISVETVRSHARSIFRKLGVSSRRGLAGSTRAPAPSPPPRLELQLPRSAHGFARERPRRPSSLRR